MANKPLTDFTSLAPAVRAEVDRMILSCEYTYREIADYISEKSGLTVKQVIVCRYALKLYRREEERRYGKPKAFKNRQIKTRI